MHASNGEIKGRKGGWWNEMKRWRFAVKLGEFGHTQQQSWRYGLCFGLNGKQE